KDLPIIQAVRALGDLESAKALLDERTAEWMKLNFPEVEDTALACIIASEFGDREEIEFTRLTELVGEEKATQTMTAAQNSFGAEFDLRDKKALLVLARNGAALGETRKELEEYLQKQSETVLKNLTCLIDALTAARLVARAGGLERLAKMPASTIQVLGAERALFKHLRKGTPSPKHGIIFQSTLIRNAQATKRGKIARALAAKLAIAAKADFYSKHAIGEKLKKDLDARIKAIKKGDAPE
ncbi:TPA: C/D box methylation guide ribonucleoprotein complex aNOP56 subunit, partial [Candidatus Micrarchaeota archaeon]|nr:C/D box methylation guide ribonucleoprotein complex aNOP56 subunit [Candidatus Micrarchaeota archaeon]